MKPITQLTLAGFLILVSCSLTAQISIGGYNVYYGHLHNHTGYSDGTGTPALAYSTAKANGLNFFGLAEHSNSLTTTEWNDTQAAADASNQPGVFTTFRGFEWTTSNYGHLAVINTPSLILTSDANYDTFSELVGWLNTQSADCFAFFNHPGEYNSAGTEFNHFDNALVTDKIVGMEQWNKTDGFAVYYANSAGAMINGYFSGDGVSFYDEALQRGWKVAPEGSEDNHVGTWGAMSTYKTAVLASANTRADLTAAFKARRFFTTNDLNVAMSFRINGSEMGSTLVLPGTYTMQIQCSDGNSETFSKVELMKNGIVASTWTPGISDVNISQQLTCANGEYYYIRIYQAGELTAFSSPVWINSGVPNVYPLVNISSPAPASTFTTPATVNITANASDSDGSISKVEFFQGGTKLGEDNTIPYTFTWSNAPVGTYVITAKATDNLGAFTTSSPVNIAVYDPALPYTVSALVAAGSDDAEESNTGVMYLTSTDIELVNDAGTGAGDQVVGLRFTNLLIPQGVHINKAYIQFTCDEVNSAAASLTIKGEAVDNSPSFTTTARSISARSKTTASVSWIPAAWPTADVAGADQRTPELAAVIQEIVDRSGFTSASALSIIVTGTGSRVAEAYEGVPASAARLVVEFVQAQSVIPLFTQIGPLCQNSTPPVLPLVSSNGISGTWNPAVILTITPGTTVYTFTPNSGQNATSTTMSITVNPLITPTFAQIGPFKQGSVPPSLPATSSNGIPGTWNPSVINTAAVGTSPYTFIPSSGQCVVPVTIQIVILEKVPPVVQITSPAAGATFAAPANVTISVTASDPDGTINKVEFYQGTNLLGTVNIGPYTYIWLAVPRGTYQLTAKATDYDGLATTSSPVNITVNDLAPVTFEKRIISGNDDVEEYSSGTMLRNSDDIELVYDTRTTGNQKVGLRFQTVTIPKGATVSKAYIQFTVDEVKTASASLLIQGQNVDNAAAFTTTKKNVSGRAKTGASVSWSPSSWSSVGASGTAQQTPDLKAIVQEIVNRTNWASGNSMVFIVSGTGTRTAKAYETSPAGAALLHVEYTSTAIKSASIASDKSTIIPVVQRSEGKLTCYPVPFTNVLNISFEPAENETLHHFAMYSISGILMKKIQTGANDLSVGLEDLSPGIYLIEAQTDYNRYIKTIVKK